MYFIKRQTFRRNTSSAFSGSKDKASAEQQEASGEQSTQRYDPEDRIHQYMSIFNITTCESCH
jgi:hypothetical protein